LHRSVDAKYYVGVVVDTDGIVVIREGVFCIDGEGGCGGCGGGSGGGRRLRRGSGHILFGGLRRRKRLHLGRHGGVVVVVVVVGGGGGGGDVFGGGDVVCGGVGVVVDALFVFGNFLV
jgi:hypothetical protein